MGKDEELMLRVKRGDHDAFAHLYHRNKARLVHFCTTLLRNEDDAIDVCQETFRYVHLNSATYEPRARVSTYLFHIARNKCIDILRKKKRWNLQPLDEAADFGETPPESVMESEELQLEIRKALDEIPDPFREVLLLRVMEGMEYGEISRVVEAPLGTVKSRIHVGLERLRQVVRRKKVIE